MVSYVMAMADVLAFLHWVARVEAADVEFVFGAPGPRRAVVSYPTLEAETLRV